MCVDDTGNVVDRSVRIGAFGIAEHNLAFAFETLQRFGIGEIIAVMMRDRAADDLARLVAARERRVGVGYFELYFAADELQRSIAHQCARQKPGFDEDLEAVADTHDHDALIGLLANGLHHRHTGCNRTAAQIVTVGKAARNQDQVHIVGNARIGLPDGHRCLSGDLGECCDHVAIAIETGKENDCGFHERLCPLPDQPMAME